MLTVVFYMKENCPLCDDAHALLLTLQKEYPFQIEERDIYTNDQWLLDYQITIPVIEINGEQLNCEQIEHDTLQQLIKSDSIN